MTPRGEDCGWLGQCIISLYGHQSGSLLRPWQLYRTGGLRLSLFNTVCIPVLYSSHWRGSQQRPKHLAVSFNPWLAMKWWHHIVGGQKDHSDTLYSPVVETWEGIFELLATRPVGQSSETGAVPVDLSIGKDDAIFLLFRQGGHDLGLAQVLLCNEYWNMVTWDTVVCIIWGGESVTRYSLFSPR